MGASNASGGIFLATDDPSLVHLLLPLAPHCPGSIDLIRVLHTYTQAQAHAHAHAKPHTHTHTHTHRYIHTHENTQ